MRNYYTHTVGNNFYSKLIISLFGFGLYRDAWFSKDICASIQYRIFRTNISFKQWKENT